MGDGVNPVGAIVNVIAGGIAYGNTMVEEGRLEERATFNRNVTKVAERDVLAKGEYQAGLARMEGAKAAAKQKVAYSASGVDTSTGTPAQVQASTERFAEMDAQTIKENAAREAWGLQVKRRQIDEDLFDAKLGLEQKRVATLLTIGSNLSNDATSALKNRR